LGAGYGDSAQLNDPNFSAVTAGFLTALVWICAVLTMAHGCSGLPPHSQTTPEQCLEQNTQRLRSLPEREFLSTMDGQKIALETFYLQCERLWPSCALYRKFYYWKSEVIDITSQTAGGQANHQIRTYYNLLSTCYPEKPNPGRTHGDVAEFYDASGEFMGLAVYMGEGLYVPLPFPGYPQK
jgi:hypothetical protein